MRRQRRREGKSALPFTALSNPGAATWSAHGALSREGFERNPVVYRCVRMIAETAASIPFRSTDGDSRLADLTARPNSSLSGPDLMEAMFSHLLVSGDAFLEAVSLEGEVRELHVLRPDRMRALRGLRGHEAGWEHRVGQDVRVLAKEADGFLPVLHMRLFHPSDDFQGHSPLEAAARAVDIHNAGGAWTKALIDNAARPSGALVYSGADELTDEQLQDLRDDLERIYQGPGNAGRPIVLQGGLDWKPMSLSPADMDFIESRHMAAREIALAFGVPPMLLGIPGDATYSNYREANTAFWRMTVLPLVNRAARAITEWLRPRVNGGLAPDIEATPAFQEDRAALWARIESASFLTLAEKRRLAGME